MAKSLKSARHHWWPRSLSQFWTDAEGRTNQLSWNGEIARSDPAQFGAIRNAHHIRLAETVTPWDETFEPVFDAADRAFPSIVEWLYTLQTTNDTSKNSFATRLQAQPAPVDKLCSLTECVVSLIVRSPAFRHSIRSTTEYYQERLGLAKVEAHDALIGLNMRGCQHLFTQAISGRGKFVALYSDAREFIFGDGFLHNFQATTTAPLTPRCLVPLTPTVSIFYVKPSSYLGHPRLFTMRLSPDHVQLLNNTVQVYSRDFLFYRGHKPEIIPEFSRREFRRYEFDQHPWLEGLADTIANTDFGPEPS